MSEEKRIPQSLWTGEGLPPKTDVVLGQVADFLEKLGYGKTLKALKKEGDSNGIPVSTDGPDDGQGLLDMWVSMAKKKEGGKDSDSSSSGESGSDSDSSSESESKSGSDDEGPHDIEKMVDDEAEVTSDDSSDEESEEEESATLPAKIGQKRKRSASVSSSDSSSSSEDSSSASSDSGDDGSSSSGSDSESTSSSSDDSDARPAKRAKVNKSKSVSSSDSSSNSGIGSSSEDTSDSDSNDSDDSSSESSSDSESESAGIPTKKAAVNQSPAKLAKLSTDSETRSGSTSSETIIADNEDKTGETLVIVEDPNAGMHPDRAKRLPTTTVENTLPATKENIKQLKKDNIPFQRVPTNTKVDPRFASNAYVSYDYADRAHRDLIVTKGKGFTKEKNKKKRGWPTQKAAGKSAEKGKSTMSSGNDYQKKAEVDPQWRSRLKKEYAGLLDSSDEDHDFELDDLHPAADGFRDDTWDLMHGCGFDPISGSYRGGAIDVTPKGIKFDD